MAWVPAAEKFMPRNVWHWTQEELVLASWLDWHAPRVADPNPFPKFHLFRWRKP